LASVETLSNSGLWNSKQPDVTFDIVSASLSPMNGDRPDSLSTSNQVKRFFNTTTVKPKLYNTGQDKSIESIKRLRGRGVARNLIWVGINLSHTLVTGTISNLSWVKETNSHIKNKKFRID